MGGRAFAEEIDDEMDLAAALPPMSASDAHFHVLQFRENTLLQEKGEIFRRVLAGRGRAGQVQAEELMRQSNE